MAELMKVDGKIKEFDSDDRNSDHAITRTTKYGVVEKRRPQFLISLKLLGAALQKYGCLESVEQDLIRRGLNCSTFSSGVLICRVDRNDCRTAEQAVEFLMKTAKRLLQV